MAMTQVREPPDVTKSNTGPHTGEQVLSFVVPFGPVPGFLLLHPLQVPMRGDPLVKPGIGKN